MVRYNLAEEPAQEDFEERPKRRYHQRRRRSIKSTCGCLFILIIIFFGLIVLSAVAKSGIVTVPIFSKIFYQIPQPSRVVNIDQEQIDKFSQGLVVSLKDQTNQIILTEEELTFFLRELAAQGSDPTFAPNVQAVVTPQNVEIFGLLLQPFRTNITLKILPLVSAGQLAFEIVEIKFGNLSLPPSLAQKLFKKVLTIPLEQLSQKVKEFGEIQKIILKERELIIEGLLNLE